MAGDGAFNRVPECAIFAERPTSSGTNARGAVGCEQEGLMARCVEKARGAVLVHDEMRRNQSLRNGVHLSRFEPTTRAGVHTYLSELYSLWDSPITCL